MRVVFLKPILVRRNTINIEIVICSSFLFVNRVIDSLHQSWATVVQWTPLLLIMHILLHLRCTSWQRNMLVLSIKNVYLSPPNFAGTNIISQSLSIYVDDISCVFRRPHTHSENFVLATIKSWHVLAKIRQNLSLKFTPDPPALAITLRVFWKRTISFDIISPFDKNCCVPEISKFILIEHVFNGNHFLYFYIIFAWCHEFFYLMSNNQSVGSPESHRSQNII
jgi:hypothetical protein